jgi:hypothetical protein
VSCQPCAHAAEHGWWGQDGTHCRGCHRSWTGLTEAHCVTCHQHFTSDRVAEMHEGYCSIIPVRVAERLRSASQKDGTPLFDIRHRKHGPTWVKFDPRTHPYASVSS